MTKVTVNVENKNAFAGNHRLGNWYVLRDKTTVDAFHDLYILSGDNNKIGLICIDGDSYCDMLDFSEFQEFDSVKLETNMPIPDSVFNEITNGDGHLFEHVENISITHVRSS